jgi:hypothetical protein
MIDLITRDQKDVFENEIRKERREKEKSRSAMPFKYEREILLGNDTL